MRNIQKMAAAINADLAEVTSDRILAYDIEHFYRFADGFDGLSRTGLRATLITPGEFLDLFDAGRQRRIDAALERMTSEMRAVGSGSVEKTATAFSMTEGCVNSELTEAQFIDLARARGYIAKDDPFFE